MERNRRIELPRGWVRLAWGLSLAAVIWGSLLTGPKLEALESRFWLLAWNDKVLHLTAYLVVALLAMLSFSRWRVQIALAMLPVGLLLEIAQLLIPGRSADWGDALADGVGVLAGIVAGILLRRATRVR